MLPDLFQLYDSLEHSESWLVWVGASLVLAQSEDFMADRAQGVAQRGRQPGRTGDDGGVSWKSRIMSAPTQIVFSPDAIDHLARLRVSDRRLILDAIETYLLHEPTAVTRRRKPLRPNPLASWELRVDRYRVYYQVAVEASLQIVTVVAVGRKIRDRVQIGGVEVKL